MVQLVIKKGADSMSGRLRWCDLKCEYAKFPDDKAVDGSGSCRTFLALYCDKLNALVQKNVPCAAGLEVKSAEKDS